MKDSCDPHSSWPLVGQSSINSNACSQPWHWFAVQKGCTVPSARHSGAQLLRRSKVCEFTCSPSCCVRGAHVPSSTRAHCPVVDLVGRGKRPRNKKIIASGIKQWYAKDSRGVGRREKWPMLQQVATITGLSFRQGIEAGYAPRWWKPCCNS